MHSPKELQDGDHDGVEALTPGRFLIGRPLESLPDPSFSYRKINLLCQWRLCQALVRHFWQCWSSEYIYLVHLQKFSKWHRKTKNLTVGDVRGGSQRAWHGSCKMAHSLSDWCTSGKGWGRPCHRSRDSYWDLYTSSCQVRSHDPY